MALQCTLFDVPEASVKEDNNQSGGVFTFQAPANISILKVIHSKEEHSNGSYCWWYTIVNRLHVCNPSFRASGKVVNEESIKRDSLNDKFELKY